MRPFPATVHTRRQSHPSIGVAKIEAIAATEARHRTARLRQRLGGGCVLEFDMDVTERIRKIRDRASEPASQQEVHSAPVRSRPEI